MVDETNKDETQNEKQTEITDDLSAEQLKTESKPQDDLSAEQLETESKPQDDLSAEQLVGNRK
jgi:hypothetical protein